MSDHMMVEEAAEFLNIAVPAVQASLLNGELPSLLRQDVEVYRRFLEAQGELAMLQMVRHAEANGLYDLDDPALRTPVDLPKPSAEVLAEVREEMGW